MSIYIKDKLAPYSYERSFLGVEGLAAWVEGTKGIEFSILGKGFTMIGSFVGTNNGVRFTKEELLNLANQMNDHSELRICFPDHYISTRNKPYMNKKTIEDVFEESNNMIQISDDSFAPKEVVIKWLETDISKIHHNYVDLCKKRIDNISNK
jgi:hypothetical protein